MAKWESAPVVETPRWQSAPVAGEDAPEPTLGQTAADVGGSALRGFNKGLVGLITLPYRGLDWLGEKATGGDFLPNAEDMPLYKPFLKQPEPTTQAGKYAGAAGEFVGGSAIPGGAILSKAEKLSKLAPETTIRALGKSLGKTFAKSPGRAVAADVAASAGAGTAQKIAEEEGADPATQMLAGMVGGVSPVVAARGVGRLASMVEPYVSPTLARWQAELGALRYKYGIHASADGGLPDSPGARAAAEQTAADQLVRAGVSANDLRTALAEADKASTFHTSGKAQNALGLVDLDPSLQRLAGSAVRASPEAGNTAQAFIAGRQTGITPANGLPEATGIPTRPLLSKPSPDDLPMGQGDRLRDAFKRALLIRDEDFHGHAANALRTDQAILKAAKDEAQSLYGATYKAGQNVDIRPAIKPVFETWAARIADEPKPVAAAIQRAMGLFSSQNGLVSNIERFDKSKQYLDGVIEKLFESPIGRNRYLGGVLNQFKNELLGAMDNVPTSGMGEKYKAARGAFGSRMEAREALQMGRDAFKQDSDIGVDAFRGLSSPGQQKLFRLGLLSGYEKSAAGMKRAADKTQLFENPRIQELLSEVIPRTETATGRIKMVGGRPAEFSDRPQRFGNFVGNEKRMIDTRNEVLGNSKTAQRLADDEAYQGMTQLSTAIEKFKQSGSAINVGIKAAQHILDKLFGMRADVAAELARMLFTANPQQRAYILASIEVRMGRDRFAHFSRLMQQIQAGSVPSAGAIATGSGTGPGDTAP